MFTSNSSQLFAGSHVLLRHIVPRHSPNALNNLLFVFVTFFVVLVFFLSNYITQKILLYRKTFPYPVFKDLFLVEVSLS